MLKSVGQNTFLRFILPIAISLILFLYTIFGILIPFNKKAIIKEREKTSVLLVTLAYKVIKNSFKTAKEGSVAEDDAKKQAIDYIKQLHYGMKGEDYFWINDMDGKMIVHPYLYDKGAELAEKIREPYVEKLLKLFVDKVKKDGEGYFSYKWFSKNNPSERVTKLSYIKLFKPWGWVIGTGIYIDDLEDEIDAMVRKQIYICLGIISVVLILYFYIAYQAKKNEERRAFAESELRESEEKYKTLFEQSGDAIIILKKLEILECNHSALKMFGYESAENINSVGGLTGLWTKTQPDGMDSEEKAKNIIKNLSQGTGSVFEWLHKKSDGTIFPTEVMLTLLPYPGSKKIIHVVIRDISRRKVAEAKLNEYKEHLEELVGQRTRQLEDINSRLKKEINVQKKLESDIKQILDCSANAVRVLSSDCKVLYVNRNFKNIFGDVKTVETGRECKLKKTEIRAVTKTGSLFPEEVNMKLNGKDFIFARECGPYLAPGGKILGVVESFRDITEIKKAEKAERESAVQQGRIDMANNILHDIGNAVTGISTASVKPGVEKPWPEIRSLERFRNFACSQKNKIETVFGTEKYPSIINYIDSLIEGLSERSDVLKKTFSKISKATSYIASILELQRVYAKDTRFISGKIDLPRLVDDAVFMLSATFEKRGVKVDYDLDQNIPEIKGDRTRLMQVFLNILKNACDAFDNIKNASGELSLRITIKNQPDGNVAVSFKDNACGFDPETAEKLFERGYTSKGRESGIGLHECRSVIKAHQGKITIKSEGENKGAEVMIIFITEKENV